MSTHITVLPASTRAGKDAIRFLLASENKPFVRGLYRDPLKAPSEFTDNPRFEAAGGDAVAGTDISFADSNAVFYIPPPTYDGTDLSQFATQAAMNVANALRKAPSVKKLVIQSGLGAQYNHGIGVLRINYISDQILKAAAPQVFIVRPGYYYENWAEALKTMQADLPRFESLLSPAEYQIPMVSVIDVGEYCARILLDESARPNKDPPQLFGPRLYSSVDVKNAIEDVTGKEGELVTIAREGLTKYWAELVPMEYVQEFVDFTTSMLPGGTMAGDFGYGENTVKCKTELTDALRDMVSG